MTDETTPKIAQQMLDESWTYIKSLPDPPVMFPQEKIELFAKHFARQVAIQVRAECAINAYCEHNRANSEDDCCDYYVDNDSILSVDIEQFLL